jgi:hypothetical protein
VRRVVPQAGHALGFLGDEEPAELEKKEGEGGIGALAEMDHVKADCCRDFLVRGGKLGKLPPGDSGRPLLDGFRGQ